AQPQTRVYLRADGAGRKVMISLRNISREMLNIDAAELMERFVRGDDSRNTEGSGLGLNIAKSLTELQGGEMTLGIDGDLFKAEIVFTEYTAE
ncbi:MAG: sensor histidine kinase, partial [Christensenellaceae bacterium]|nr:sensor histidine kinase [Christensenellaceae bacterium]